MSVPATLCKRYGVLCHTSDHNSHIGVAGAAALPIRGPFCVSSGILWHGACALVLMRLAQYPSDIWRQKLSVFSITIK